MDRTTKTMTSQPGVQLHTSTSPQRHLNIQGPRSLKVTEPERPHSFIGALQSSGQGLLWRGQAPWALGWAFQGLPGGPYI